MTAKSSDAAGILFNSKGSNMWESSIKIAFVSLLVLGIYSCATDPKVIAMQAAQEACYKALSLKYDECVLNDKPNCSEKHSVWVDKCHRRSYSYNMHSTNLLLGNRS